MKKYHTLLGILGIIFVLGVLHTSWSFWSLVTCNGCSAPASTAFFFPGLFYFFILMIGFIIYFFLRKQKVFGRILLAGLGLICGLIYYQFVINHDKRTWEIKNYPTPDSWEAEMIKADPVPEFGSEEEKVLIEQYLENKHDLDDSKEGEKRFCAYHGFDQEKNKNQTIAYGLALCESYSLEDQVINCPDDPEIEKQCLGMGECSSCEIQEIPEHLERKGGFSIPMKFFIEGGEVVDQRSPRDGSEHYQSLKTHFSEKALEALHHFHKGRHDLHEKIEHKLKNHFGI